MADLVTVALSAGIGAAVSAVGVIVGQVLQGRTQRGISADARTHELRLNRDADARSLRDAKLDRLRSNLRVVTKTAMSLLDAVQLLDADAKRQVGEADRTAKDLSDRLQEIRSDLVLDAESDSLLVDVFNALRQYQNIAGTWRVQIQTYEATIHAPGAPGRDSVVTLAEKAGPENKTLQTDIHGLIARARTLLADLEQPLG